MWVASFYRFIPIDHPGYLQDEILKSYKPIGIVGTVLIAWEGINATIAHAERSVLQDRINKLGACIQLDLGSVKWSNANPDNSVFRRLKVQVRNEIVAFQGVFDFSISQPQWVSAEKWNSLLRDPDTTVIDVRNAYEAEIGRFPGTISSETETFREFPAFVKGQLPGRETSVAMYCTGGIRCEKAANWMIARGYENIHVLDGGVLNYLANVTDESNAWIGECFVFDQRISINRNLQQGSYEQCFACRRPLSSDDRKASNYVPGVSCSRCYQNVSDDRKATFKERFKQEVIARSRGTKHLGYCPNRCHIE